MILYDQIIFCHVFKKRFLCVILHFAIHFIIINRQWSEALSLPRYNDNGLNLELEMILLSSNHCSHVLVQSVSTKNYLVCIELEYKVFLLLGVMKDERIIRLFLKSALYFINTKEIWSFCSTDFLKKILIKYS